MAESPSKVIVILTNQAKIVLGAHNEFLKQLRVQRRQQLNEIIKPASKIQEETVLKISVKQ